MIKGVFYMEVTEIEKEDIIRNGYTDLDKEFNFNFDKKARIYFEIKKIDNKYVAELQDCDFKIERNLLTYLLAFLLETFPNYRSNESNFGSSRLMPEEKEAKKHLLEIYENMYQGIKIFL